jgi:hypothetical protein
VSDWVAAPPEEAAPSRLWARLRARRSHWALLVAGCAGVLVAAALAMAALWLVTSGTRTSSYGFAGPLLGVEIEIGRGDVEILGGGRSDVHVRRTESYAYGHEPRERLALDGGVLRIASDCASLVVGSCSAAYSVAVPDNVPVTVNVAHGDVRLAAYRGSAHLATQGGGISVDAFCGFVLEATAKQGDVDVATACSPERLDLRSDSGDVRAVVPPARYRIDADSSSGRVDVRGLDAADDAPWEIRALSGSGDVSVAAGS